MELFTLQTDISSLFCYNDAMNNSPAAMENEPQIEVDIAKPGDSKGIAAVQKAGWLAAYPDESVGLTTEDIEAKDFDSEEQLQKWETAIEEAGDSKKLWVARQNGRVIGFSVAWKDDDKNELKAIYVLPEFHGKSIGKPLMNAAIEWLGNKKDIVVWVFTHNERAINFYRKQGFVESGNTSTWAVNGKNIPDMEMIKKVQSS